MHRFFVKPADVSVDTGLIIGEDAHHIGRVLRLQPGDDIVLCDGAGWDYRAVIANVDKNRVTCRIVSRSGSTAEPRVRVTLYQGLPKGAKMELIIQKCVELGINAIVPVTTDRTVVKLNREADAGKKTARWQKVAEEAAKQSGRGIIPEIHDPMDLLDACRKAGADVKLLLWEGERERSLRRVLENRRSSQTMAVFVGSEGGLTREEADFAAENGWQPVSLGPRILRTETAGLAVLSAIMYAMEEMEW